MKNCGFAFIADFPDDMIDEGEGEDWHVVRPGGMAMAQAVTEILRNAGIAISDPEPDLEHECWELMVPRGAKGFDVGVYQIGEDQSVMVWGSSPLLKRLFNRRDAYAEYLRTLGRGLRRDSRFSNVQLIDVNRRPISEEQA